MTKLLRNWFSPPFVKAWTLLSWKYQYLDFHLILSSVIPINWESSSWPTTILCYCAFKAKVACKRQLTHLLKEKTLGPGKSEKMLLEIYIDILVPIQFEISYNLCTFPTIAWGGHDGNGSVSAVNPFFISESTRESGVCLGLIYFWHRDVYFQMYPQFMLKTCCFGQLYNLKFEHRDIDHRRRFLLILVNN